MNIEPPKASIAKSKSEGAGAAFHISYCFLWVPPHENGNQPQSYGAIPANSYFDTSTPCSWNLTLTTGNTHGGETNP